MAQPQRWWIGLLLLIPFWLVVGLKLIPEYEKDIANRAAPAVSASSKLLGKPEIGVQGRDVLISGTEYASGSRTAAVAAAEAVEGVRLARQDIKALIAQNPYTFGAERDGRKIVLSGYVPSPDVREKITEAARKAAGANGTIEDTMQYASGAGAGFAEQAMFGIGLAGQLTKGVFGLSGSTASLKGATPDSATYERLLAAMTSIPAGGKAGTIDLRPPAAREYNFAAAHNAGAIALTGLVPSSNVRAALNAAAKAAPGVKSVDDKLAFASGVPAGFADVAKTGIGLAAALKNGLFSFNNGVANLSGEAPDSATYDRIRAAMMSLPGGVKAGNVELVPPPAATYSFGAAHSGDRIVLSGSVPSPQVRAQLVAAAKSITGVTAVDDRMTYASGAPEKFADAAMAGIGLAGALRSGQFSYRNGVADLSGEAPDSATYGRVLGAMKGLPGGARAGNVAVTPPTAKTYVFNAERSGNTLTLTGQAPSPQVRAALNAVARSAIGSGNVVDRMTFASGAPDNFPELAGYGVKQVARLKSGSFVLKDNSASLRGDAPDSSTYSDLLGAMANLPRGGRTALVDILPPPADPYRFSARHDGKTIVLGGSVPSPEVRNRLLAAVSATGKQARDELSYASGAPADFESFATLGIKAASGLGASAFELNGTLFNLQGNADTLDRYNTARRDVANFPRAMRPGRVEIRAPLARPFVWEAKRDASSISLSGSVPDEGIAAEIERRARAALPGVSIANTMRIARGAPGLNFPAAAEVGLRQLALLNEGTATLTDDVLSISGKAADIKRGDSVRSVGKSALPRGLKIGTVSVTNPAPPKVAVPMPPPAPVAVPVPPKPEPPKVIVPAPPKLEAPKVAEAPQPPADCAAGADGAIARATLYFPSGSTQLLAASQDDFAKLAEKAKACAKASIELRGHADFRGSRRANIVLSSRRTFAIKRRLVGAGIDRGRIRTIGFGEDRPVSDNKTFDGRAKNRRVEITLK